MKLQDKQQEIASQTLKSLEILAARPDLFIENVLGDNLYPYQEQLVSTLAKERFVSIASCHGIGKSFTAARVVLWFLITHPRSIVLTTAPTNRQVKDVLWKEIRSAYRDASAHLGGKILELRFELAEDWYAIGLSTNEPDRFQGYHAPHILIVIDESSGVPAPIFEAIEGIGSTGNVYMLELGNPTDPTGHFAQTFKNPFYKNYRISCFDTPNFLPFRRESEDESIEALINSTIEQRKAAVVDERLIVPEWVYRRYHIWGKDSPMFQARCLGKFPLEGDDTLIPLRHALRAVDNENVVDQEKEVLGVDIARFGSDETVLVYRRGNKVETIQRFRKDDLMTTVGRINVFHQAHPYAGINIDDSGVGGGVTDRLREMKVAVNPINVGSMPNNKQIYANLRAELYWELAQMFERGEIIIPNDDQLISELTSMKYKYLNGKIVIESKDEMKKRGLNSPDSADAVMLAFADSKSSSFDTMMSLGL